ncbi:ABC transporter ATP-binding protein [Streptomyces sp. NPDC005876]|jgi:ABC-type multidrug transport system ATPase subunit|uniref:ABC transporter ATP-binding protein n=1 Tax=unclassified Streptomyces TaxID=2593676 RepID=UPI00340927E6
MASTHAAHIATSSAPALQVTDVAKTFGRREVLRGVALELPSGCLAGVVGENGSGKSTLLNILAGRLAPDSGTVRVAGRVGYCPQEPVLNASFTVDQHLELFRAAYGLVTLDRAYELVEALGFAAYRGERVDRLSGGTRQKLNVVLALMHEPPLLLLDEPYQGFDWETYHRFWGLAGELRAGGCTLLVVSHIAHDIERFDRLWRMEEGCLVPDEHPDSGPGGRVTR